MSIIQAFLGGIILFVIMAGSYLMFASSGTKNSTKQIGNSARSGQLKQIALILAVILVFFLWDWISKVFGVWLASSDAGQTFNLSASEISRNLWWWILIPILLLFSAKISEWSENLGLKGTWSTITTIALMLVSGLLLSFIINVKTTEAVQDSIGCTTKEELKSYEIPEQGRIVVACMDHLPLTFVSPLNRQPTVLLTKSFREGPSGELLSSTNADWDTYIWLRKATNNGAGGIRNGWNLINKNEKLAKAQGLDYITLLVKP